jgi:glycosyltransferase involved in cell wall biosynthesis
MAHSIAFIRIFESAPIGHSVEKMLQESFPEYNVHTIVLTKLLKHHPFICFLNLFPMLLLYGLDLLRGQKRLRGAFFATPFLFRQVKRLVRQQLQSTTNEYVFSFQLQSFFDTSTGFMPHFVYTDHTHLANLSYPNFDKNQLYAEKWVALEKQIYERATAVFTRSTNITHSLIDQYGINPEKIHCIYVGINTAGGVTMQSPAHYQEKNILFVGIDWERKGGPKLLAAFKKVSEIHADAHLTIVGATPEINLPASC